LDAAAAVRVGAPCCHTREKEEWASSSRGGKLVGRKMKREALKKKIWAPPWELLLLGAGNRKLQGVAPMGASPTAPRRRKLAGRGAEHME
jgi:hypothetical protein